MIAMNATTMKDLFTCWLANNRHLFTWEPYIDHEVHRHFVVKFKGITPLISCGFYDGGDISVHVDYFGRYFDIIQELDIREEMTPEGRYFCRECRDYQEGEVPEYDSREELWAEHSFKPLAEYVSETFTDGSMLLLCNYKGGTSAVIGEGERLEMLKIQRRDIFKVIPVVRQRKLKQAA